MRVVLGGLRVAIDIRESLSLCRVDVHTQGDANASAVRVVRCVLGSLIDFE